MATNDVTRPQPNGSLATSVWATLTDLADVAEELDDGPPYRPSLATKLTTLSGELAEAAAMIRAIPGTEASRG